MLNRCTTLGLLVALPTAPALGFGATASAKLAGLLTRAAQADAAVADRPAGTSAPSRGAGVH